MEPHDLDALLTAQHGVVTIRQLAELGHDAPELLAGGRLRPVLPGILARRGLLTPEGRSTAATLAALAGLAGEPTPADLRAAIDRVRRARTPA